MTMINTLCRYAKIIIYLVSTITRTILSSKTTDCVIDGKSYMIISTLEYRNQINKPMTIIMIKWFILWLHHNIIFCLHFEYKYGNNDNLDRVSILMNHTNTGKIFGDMDDSNIFIYKYYHIQSRPQPQIWCYTPPPPSKIKKMLNTNRL